MPASSIRPGTATVSARNLAYLDEHIQRYIASGTLAGTLTVVYHKDRGAHWSARGSGPRAGHAGRGRHDLAHLLDDETDRLGGADAALRTRPGPAR